jgi:predicted transcriptional regulator
MSINIHNKLHKHSLENRSGNDLFCAYHRDMSDYDCHEVQMSPDERKAEIMQKLKTGKTTTYTQLATDFSVSISTIKRDVEKLHLDWKFPIDTLQGRYGGIKLNEYYFELNKRRLTKDEPLLRANA